MPDTRRPADPGQDRIILSWLAEHGVQLGTLNDKPFAGNVDVDALRAGIEKLTSTGPEDTVATSVNGRRRQVLHWLTLAASHYPETDWPRLVEITANIGRTQTPPIGMHEVDALHALRICDLYDPPGTASPQPYPGPGYGQSPDEVADIVNATGA